MYTYLRLAALTALICLTASCSEIDCDGTLSATTADGREVTVTAVNDYAVRVTNMLPGDSSPVTQAVILPVAKFNGSARVVDGNYIMSLPSGLNVTLNKTTGSVTLSNREGTMLVDNALRPSTDSTQTVSLWLDSLSTFYGAGERGHALALNGDTLVVYNKQNYSYTASEKRISQMNISMPLIVSDRGYALLFDDHAAATLTLTNPLLYSSEAAAPLAYYFVYGGKENNLMSATERLTELTGRQPLPPFWALGYITSKYGYKNEAEARGVIDTLKQRGYPVDGIVLDLYWYGTETDMGRLEWNKQQWPNHKDMLADFKKQGVNTVLISQPYINKKGAIDNYNYLAENGMLVTDRKGDVNDVTTWVGDAGMFDVSNPATQRWLAERYRQLTDEGVGGWWGDLGEPEVHPQTIMHNNGMTARQYHNVYGNQWSKIIYDLYQQSYPDTRLMTLMRGGTTGLQRYSVFPWSTDVSRSWGGLEPQVRIMLNSGLSGLGYMSHDVGGFAVDSLNPTDPELYLRWMQLGVFSPVLRTHAQLYAEPYHYPDIQPALLELVKTRYNWLPYNYTLAYENALTGLPLVRPINFASTSVATSDVDDQYLWGNNVLVAPVLTKGATSRKVVLPEGTWIDYNNPRLSFTGPGEINYKAPLTVIPLFIRNGAFIPQADYDMANTRDYDASRYTVLYYPRGDVSSTYTLYEDNRQSTTSLEQNEYALLQFTGKSNGRAIDISMTIEGEYPDMPKQKNITFVLPGISSDQVKSVVVDNVDVAPVNNSRGWLTFSAAAATTHPIQARIILGPIS
ncbi:MAG: DUF5110 domain-containing protein [Muribaculum sp.]|nr:DUF5110 domain-containing protein [Muribaculaceae bacterium]MCM1081808.1 DUF5110 domain-containing protein [Muribaculum sp.]